MTLFQTKNIFTGLTSSHIFGVVLYPMIDNFLSIANENEKKANFANFIFVLKNKNLIRREGK